MHVFHSEHLSSIFYCWILGYDNGEWKLKSVRPHKDAGWQTDLKVEIVIEIICSMYQNNSKFYVRARNVTFL